ncbi:S-4TM family putative pore-forming effector [Lysinibacillus sphaericus]|nr:S-4TM family putative pore-forming effector [Lysinibacillus sp. SDF0037]
MIMNELFPIKERQNTPENIIYLRGQRQAYKQAKNFYMWRMLLSIAWPIIAVILYFTFENEIANAVIVVSSLILIATFIIEYYEKAFTKMGATIQESFDTNVFNLKWNSHLIGGKISKEDIVLLAEKEKTEEYKLKDWYTGIATDNESEYTLKAQRMNTAWSIKQKEKFSMFLFLSGILIFTSLVIIGCYTGFELYDFLIMLFFPTVSLFIYLFKGWFDFLQQVKELKRITSSIDDLLDKQTKVTKQELRSIQDSIYIHGRIPNNIIPDVLYNRMRSKLEQLFRHTNK